MGRRRYSSNPYHNLPTWLYRSDVVWTRTASGLSYRQLGEALYVDKESARQWFLGNRTPAEYNRGAIGRAVSSTPTTIGNEDLAGTGRNRVKTFTDAQSAISYLQNDDGEWLFDDEYFCIERVSTDQYKIYFQLGK